MSNISSATTSVRNSGALLVATTAASRPSQRAGGATPIQGPVPRNLLVRDDRKAACPSREYILSRQAALPRSRDQCHAAARSWELLRQSGHVRARQGGQTKASGRPHAPCARGTSSRLRQAIPEGSRAPRRARPREGARWCIRRKRAFVLRRLASSGRTADGSSGHAAALTPPRPYG